MVRLSKKSLQSQAGARVYEGIPWLVRVPKKKKFDAAKGVRRLARERVGTVPSGKVITPTTKRKKPKHKPPLEAGALE
jgi:hypothetical protein